MTVFELGLSDYDYYERWLFAHDSKTKDEFEKDVHKALSAVGDSLLAEAKKNNDYIYMGDWFGAIIPQMKEWGYEYIKPEIVSFSKDRLNSLDHDDYDDTDFRAVVGDGLYRRVIHCNFDRKLNITRKREYWFTLKDVDNHFHEADCEVLQNNKDQRVDWVCKKWLDNPEGKAYEIYGHKPCPVCNPLDTIEKVSLGTLTVESQDGKKYSGPAFTICDPDGGN